VRARVGIEGVVYAGNHGLEIAGGGIHYEAAAALALAEDIAAAVATLEARLRDVPGVLVEAKGLTASAHYRLVDPVDRVEVERVVRETVGEDHPTLRVAGGKMVWEVRPRVPWNKGSAVRWIREQLGLREALTVYLGDDQTDEDAFAEVGPFVTARVGSAPATRAGYHVADTDEVAEFLVWLSRQFQFADRPSAPGPGPAGPPRGSRQATSECEG
jgi:trehalose-phosphatase